MFVHTDIRSIWGIDRVEITPLRGVEKTGADDFDAAIHWEIRFS
jgi:hypothetical protein